MAKSSTKAGSLDQSMDALDIFTDMYVIDPAIEHQIEAILESKELHQLVNKAKSSDNVSPLLDEVLPDEDLHEQVSLFKRFTKMVKPFYEHDEYTSKKSYLKYLRNVYGFMIHPFEDPPNRVLNLFYPDLKNSWEPAKDHGVELLRRFYLETQLIQDLTDEQWQHIYRSGNPEAALIKSLYGIRFNPKFQDFLKDIPWMMAEDYYGAPALDTSYWRTPGPELPRKPMGIDIEFIEKLVVASVDNKAYSMVVTESTRSGKIKSKKLTATAQILTQINREGIARIDSYIGLSKRENDFVIFQRIMVWPNPGYELYNKATSIKKLKMTKPPCYLATIQERVIPLEIPFLKPKLRGTRKSINISQNCY